MVDKRRVRNRWEREPAGTRGVERSDRRSFFEQMLTERTEMHPYLSEFAGFDSAADERVLEIGIGPGNDFQRWVESDADVVGIDITDSATKLTKERLDLFEVDDEGYAVLKADAENLPFRDETFDVVYSFGVFHHTPRMREALSEAHRVLRPGGELRTMIYAVPSWTGFLLWLRHGLLAGRPTIGQKEAIFHNLESRGTKAFRDEEVRSMLSESGFVVRDMRRALAPGDLLENEIPEKYESPFYELVWRLYPSRLVEALGRQYSFFNLIRAHAAPTE